MRFIKFLKCLMNREATLDEIISLKESGYRQAQLMYPGVDPHMLLAQVWLDQIAEIEENPTFEMARQAFSETIRFACVAPPNNARALMLDYMSKEFPHIFQKYPKFGQELDRLMAPVRAAIETGSIETLYQQLNPLDSFSSYISNRLLNDNLTD